tara:strand:- start:14 stop:859 length:846 start_codon:yes stop_codon:yes gene_type:complete
MFMGKIIWISSYPKSGNTWVRYLLANYFYNQSRIENANIIDNIKKFHINEKFKKISNLENIKKNPFHISKYWIPSQENLIKNNKLVFFLKNHNSLVRIEENNFTKKEFCLATIYIVRDPRDVAVSFAHFSNLSYDKTIDKLLSEELFASVDSNNPWNIEIIGSYKFHYNSWKNGIISVPSIIIKYEDLIYDTHGQLLKIISFLSKILNFDINHEQLIFSVNNSSFDTLKKFEKENKFKEKGVSNQFFRKGKRNDWINELSKSQILRIERALSKEMDILGYN